MDKLSLVLSALLLATLILLQGCYLSCTTAYPRHPGDPAGDRDCQVGVRVPVIP